MRATFVVLAGGYLGRRIKRLASEHAALDADRRCVLCDGDAGFPASRRLDAWRNGAAIAAVVLNPHSKVCERLDVIEDAFLRASREFG